MRQEFSLQDLKTSLAAVMHMRHVHTDCDQTIALIRQVENAHHFFLFVYVGGPYRTRVTVQSRLEIDPDLEKTHKNKLLNRCLALSSQIRQKTRDHY